MEKIAVVIPAVVQNKPSLDLLCAAVRSLPAASGKLYLFIKILCNRLSVCGTTTLHAHLANAFKEGIAASGVEVTYTLEVVNDRERTVAGAWNEGFRRSIADRAESVAFMAADCRPDVGVLRTLFDFGKRWEEAYSAAWSGCDRRFSKGPTVSTEGLDCTLFMVRPETIAMHGFFDENFKPAYFEDNDYHARIVLGGEYCKVVHGATFEHLGSQTINLDAEMAHHVRHWFPLNREYFVRKWGCEPVANPAEMRERYNVRPFDNRNLPLCWWELEPDRR